MKTIRDTIHGNINLNDFELSILDTAEMQRLRGIKQLGFTYLVYPSATHTRFEHSLGAFYLADKLGRMLNLNEEKKEKVKIAALLHDIGHGPFSHSTEDALRSYNKSLPPHEENTRRIIQKSAISDTLKKEGFNPAEITKIAVGKKSPLSDIVSGEIDVDRMDYLVRDSYYTGAAYGVIDLDRILQTLGIYRNHLVIEEEGLSAAEALVLARYLMYPTVYQHHTSRIVNAMYSYAISLCLDEKSITAGELYSMDETALLSKLRNANTAPSEIMQRIEQRKLYKTATMIYKETFGNFKKVLSIKPKKLRQLQIEITEAADLKEGDVLVDVPKRFYTKEATMPIRSDGTLKPLKDASPLAKALLEAQWNYWYVGVYCNKKNVKKVSRVAGDILLGF